MNFHVHHIYLPNRRSDPARFPYGPVSPWPVTRRGPRSPWRDDQPDRHTEEPPARRRHVPPAPPAYWLH